MGVGYATSALHRVIYVEPVPGSKPRPQPPFILDLLGGPNGKVTWDGGPTHFVSPAVEDILAWRDRISTKYLSQLGEILSWNERSDFEQSEDARTDADVLLRYVAAVLDRQGPEKAARALLDSQPPPFKQYDAEFADADRRGFTGRFPQLLLGGDYWLPFQRNLIIEEPDWRNDVQRFGSSFRLADEVAEIRSFIAAADRRATAWNADRYDDPPDVFSLAWQASDMVSRLCAIARSRNLPFWTTG